MALYGVRKTISYDVYAEVNAESEREVYERLDDNAILFDVPEHGMDEETEVFLIEDKEE